MTSQKWIKKQPAKKKSIPEDVLISLRRQYLGNDDSQEAASEESHRESSQPANGQDEIPVNTEVQPQPLTFTTVRGCHSEGCLIHSLPAVAQRNVASYEHEDVATPQRMHDADPSVPADTDTSLPQPSQSRSQAQPSLCVPTLHSQNETSSGAWGLPPPTLADMSAAESLLKLAFQWGNAAHQSSVSSVPTQPYFTLSPVDWSTVAFSRGYASLGQEVVMDQQPDMEDAGMEDSGMADETAQVRSDTPGRPHYVHLEQPRWTTL